MLIYCLYNCDNSCWFLNISVHPPPAFGSSPNLEALALEANKSDDQDEEHSVDANTQFAR